MGLYPILGRGINGWRCEQAVLPPGHGPPLLNMGGLQLGKGGLNRHNHLDSQRERFIKNANMYLFSCKFYTVCCAPVQSQHFPLHLNVPYVLCICSSGIVKNRIWSKNHR